MLRQILSNYANAIDKDYEMQDKRTDELKLYLSSYFISRMKSERRRGKKSNVCSSRKNGCRGDSLS